MTLGVKTGPEGNGATGMTLFRRFNLKTQGRRAVALARC